MGISRRETGCESIVGSQELDNVDQFIHLGSSVTKNVYSNKKIRSCIAVAKNAFTKKGSLLTNNLRLREKLIKCNIWSILLVRNIKKKRIRNT